MDQNPLNNSNLPKDENEQEKEILLSLFKAESSIKLSLFICVLGLVDIIMLLCSTTFGFPSKTILYLMNALLAILSFYQGARYKHRLKFLSGTLWVLALVLTSLRI